MKKLLLTLLACFGCVTAFALTAPDNLYLVGQVTNSDWDPSKGIKFEKSGNIFTLTGVQINGGFAFLPTTSGWNGQFGPSSNEANPIVGDNGNAFGAYNSNSWAIKTPGVYYDIKVDFEAAKMYLYYPDHYYIMGYANGNDFSPNKGVISTKADNGVYTFENITIADVDNSGYGYFSFCLTIGNNWENVTGRFYAPSKDYLISAGHSSNIQGTTDNSWKIAAGNYDITLDIPNLNMKVAAANEPPAPEVITYDIWSNWTDPEWSSTPLTESNGKWIAAKASIPAGNFGIRELTNGTQTNWFSAADASVIVPNQPMQCKVNGQNFSNASGEYAIEFDPVALTITFTGTQTGGNVKPDYSSWYVNILYEANNWADNGVNPDADTDIATLNNLEVGNGGFKVKVWNGSDNYFKASGNIPTGEWVSLTSGTGDDLNYIANATTSSVFNIQYNVESNKIFVTLVENTEPNPGEEAPEVIYFRCNLNWDNGYSLEKQDDGTYKGTVELPASTPAIEFKLDCGDNQWYGPIADQEDVTLTNGQPTELTMNVEATNNWTLTNFDGGKIIATVNWEEENKVLTLLYTKEEEPGDGVNALINSIDESDAIYTLQGVKVDRNRLNKGIYVINGKKVLVK